jgi:hypothetical protein
VNAVARLLLSSERSIESSSAGPETKRLKIESSCEDGVGHSHKQIFSSSFSATGEDGHCKQPREVESVDNAVTTFRQAPEERTFNTDWKNKLEGKRLRYFSTTELARLFGFHVEDGKPFFPSGISNRKGYELLGNSLNVDVATHLLRFLICKDLKAI